MTSSAKPTGASAGTGTGLSAAKAAIAPYLTTPTSINLTAPLSAKPATGKLVYAILNNNPGAVRVGAGLQAATKVLGWRLRILTWASDPSVVNNDILQAVQAKADFITYLAAPAALLKTGIAAARAKRIPVFESFDATPPEGPANWLFTNTGGTSVYGNNGRINADYLIAESGGDANVLLVNVPAFPVLVAWDAAAKAEFAKNCTSCKVSEFDATYADVVAGNVSSQVIGYLRTHPAINNIMFITTVAGFTQAAKSAGIKLGNGGIRVTIQQPEDADLLAIRSGVISAGVSTPVVYCGWLLIDAMARYSLHMDLKANWQTVVPPMLQTASNTTNGTDLYLGPTGYQSQFKKLWHLG